MDFEDILQIDISWDKLGDTSAS